MDDAKNKGHHEKFVSTQFATVVNSSCQSDDSDGSLSLEGTAHNYEIKQREARIKKICRDILKGKVTLEEIRGILTNF